MNNLRANKKLFWKVLSGMLLFVSLFGYFPRSVHAVAPTNLLSYQGRLLNSNRVPVSDASASVLFELYTASSGGTCVWSNSSATCASATARTVTLTDGLFSENLGDTADAVPYAAIGDTIFGDNATLYLQITVNGESLSPRKQIAAAPYALNAQMLDGLDFDSDGSTATAIVALNASGNLVVTGNPGGSGVSNGSLYVNPASADTAVDDTLFGVALEGTSVFRVDAEGDTMIGGNISLGGSSISSTTATVNLFDDTAGVTRLDIGGVDADRANTINIATNATSADAITIGNSNAASTLALTGGTTWSVSTAGVATLSNMNCTDCVNWSDFTDSAALDATTTVTLGASDFVFSNTGIGDFVVQNTSGEAFTINQQGAITLVLNADVNPDLQMINNGSGNILTNLVSTGDVVYQDNGSVFLTISDAGAYTFTLDAVDNPAYTITNSGSSNVITNLAGTGDVTFQDNGATFLTLSDAGAFTLVLDATDNPGATITNSGSGNVLTNLAGTGDFLIQDNGTTYAAFSDTGTLTLTDAVTVSSSSRAGNLANSTTVTGTWDGALGARSVTSWNLSGDYQAAEAVGTDGTYTALNISAQISTNGDLNSLYGGQIVATNNSADAAAVESSMYGLFASASNAAAVTVPITYGLYGQTIATAGTVTTGYGVFGSVASGAGSFTTSYGGYFQSVSEGTTRYGVVGSASGGTNNYSGYFINGMVHIDDNTNSTDTAATNAAVAGAGDLFIRDSLEGDGSLYYGDTTGTDDFIFTSAVATGTVFTLSTNPLTTGTGFQLTRGNGVATDFDGTLLNVQQNRTSAGSDGTVVSFTNMGGGNAKGLYIIQDQVVDATTAPTAQALVIDVNESASSDEVILIRSDADNSSGLLDTEFRFENDGDAFADGAWTGAGADYAEYFPSTDHTLGDYEVVCLDARNGSAVRRCAAGEAGAIGVISTDPGFIGNSYSGAEKSLEDDPNYALVGLVGQIETNVSADAGPIHIGDPLAVSALRAGYAEKTNGGTYIIGRALEPLVSGIGTIKVLVQPMWYGGDLLSSQGNLALKGENATAENMAVDSAGISFVGSLWNGSSAKDTTLSLRNALSLTGTSQLSLANDHGTDVMTFGNTGDLAIAGNFYPSDRGVLQYGAYVYYDSTDAGYIKTNSAGWSSAMSSFAESFSSTDTLLAGEVVEFSQTASDVVRSTGETYSKTIAGVISPNSGFVAGDTVGSYTVAVSGRVNTKVSTENGSIAPGDALTTSSRPGVAMKATAPGQIVGYALQSLASGEGSILVFVRPQYAVPGSTPVTQSVAVQSQDIETLNVSGLLSMNGGNIINVGTLSGIGTWEIRENGDVVTSGQLTQVVESLQHTRVSTYATTSLETIVQLSGTSTLHGGLARISFEQINPDFNDIISPEHTYRVLVTPNDITGQLYVTDRTNTGFIIRDSDQSEGVSVDWLVLAYRFDLLPEEHDTDDALLTAPDTEELYEEPFPVSSSSEDILPEVSPDTPTPIEEDLELEEVQEDDVAEPSLEPSVLPEPDPVLLGEE